MRTHGTMSGDATEHGTAGNARGLEPDAQRPHRAEFAFTAWNNGPLVAAALLVGLAAPHRDE